MSTDNMPQQDYSAYPPKHARADTHTMKWSHGKIVVPGTEKKNELWLEYGTTGYNLENLKKIYPWAKVLRGGVIPIYNGSLFIVREKDRVIIDDEEYYSDRNVVNGIISGFYGFPKGAVDYKTDRTIVDTAIREFHEEVGINLDPSDLWYPTFVLERAEVGEIFFYFPIIFSSKPDIAINEHELSGGTWMTLAEINNNYDMKNRMSNPTKMIMSHLSKFLELCFG